MTATTWPQDLILNFRVELAPELPLGKLDENIMLRVEGTPNFLLVRDVVLPVRGIVAPENPPIEKVAP
jgi:hypothetical protein